MPQAADRLAALGYTNVRQLDGGLQGWQAAGYELFQDVNSYAKAFGELVESRRHTPSLPADDVAALIAGKANIAILDVRRFDEYATMNIPGSVSVPGAELVLRAGRAAPDPATTIIVNCAGRTRSIIGTQSLINAGVANKVVALRNGTIGWTLANRHARARRGPARRGRRRSRAPRPMPATSPIAPASGTSARNRRWRCRRKPTARSIASTFATPKNMPPATSPAFATIAGGQLVQEIDMAAPVRGARILLTDDKGVRADMTASWLAQMGWEVYVLDGGYDGALEAGPPEVVPKPDPSHRYRRPYEGTGVDADGDAGLSRLGIWPGRATQARRARTGSS